MRMSKQTGAGNDVKATYFRNVLERFSAHKLAVAGLIILFTEIILVLILPPLLNLDPYTSDPIAFGAAPSAEHVLGTDDVGRDLLARLVYGGRVSLMVGLLSTLISLCLGVPLGLIAGFYRKLPEIIIMRIADIFMSFPAMILVLVLVAVVGPSVWSVTLVIGVMGWPQFARLIYGNVLSVREKEYVEYHCQIRFAQLVHPGSHCHNLPHGAGYYYGVLSQLSGYGCAAAAGFLGQYDV